MRPLVFCVTAICSARAVRCRKRWAGYVNFLFLPATLAEAAARREIISVSGCSADINTVSYYTEEALQLAKIDICFKGRLKFKMVYRM